MYRNAWSLTFDAITPQQYSSTFQFPSLTIFVELECTTDSIVLIDLDTSFNILKSKLISFYGITFQ